MEEFERKINNELGKNKRIYRTIYLLGILFAVLFCINFFQNFGKSFSLWIFVLAILSIGLIVTCSLLKEKYMRELKEKIMATLLPKLFGDRMLIYIPSGMHQREFDASGMYKEYTNYYSSDGIKDFENKFYIANVIAKKEIEKSKKSVFEGIFGYVELDKYIGDTIIIKPSFENKYIAGMMKTQNKMLGATPHLLHMENSTFNNFFEVYSKDSIRAREVVTLGYMEKLLKIRNELNAPIKIVYDGNKKYVAIWNKQILNEKDIYKNGLKIENIKYQIEKYYYLLQEV